MLEQLLELWDIFFLRFLLIEKAFHMSLVFHQLKSVTIQGVSIYLTSDVPDRHRLRYRGSFIFYRLSTLVEGTVQVSHLAAIRKTSECSVMQDTYFPI